MIIGLDLLLPRVRNGELITPLAERELNNPEGAGFDLRAGGAIRDSRRWISTRGDPRNVGCNSPRQYIWPIESNLFETTTLLSR